MRSFLEQVVQEISEQEHQLSDTVFVLPSKRAGTFLRNAIANTHKQTFFAPEIYSIEGFVEKISGLSYATSTQQLFELYSAYQVTSQGEKDNFFAFSKWGQTLLQDFNEIGRYLVDSKKLFSNLSAIQELEHWSVEAERTKMMQDYLDFWNKLDELYSTFNSKLLEKGQGHQGLVYREACEKLNDYLANNLHKKHVFIGFNALNTAESQIIQNILENSEANIFWDIDSYFLNDPIHDAGHFIRLHQKNWPYLKEHPLKGIDRNYELEKNIQITGVPKNVSQAKYVGNLLSELKESHPESLKNTAVILADESLLNPVLNSIPASIEAVNITMGYPLQKTPLASLFSEYLEIYLHKEPQGWFYKNILSFLAHPSIKELLNNEIDGASKLTEAVKKRNWTYITPQKFKSILEEEPCLSLLFFDATPTPILLVKNCLKIILQLKSKLQKTNDTLALEYLYRFYKLFNQVLELVQNHSFIDDLKSLQGLYNELLSSETVDFQGDPLEGLQVMGMLESRNLDFETVIITSVNEGILPSGKSNNSFIPFDLKASFGLPTYKEKDAVYTYHFYRLLQRAKNIHILYNTEPDVLEGGEKSRLITQLLTDLNKIDQITNKVAAPSIIANEKKPINIDKDASLLELIKSHAMKGFSPTSLSNYIRNPIDFYKRNLLGIDDVLEVEETVAANTFGTIVHDTLEELYTPLIGKVLSAIDLNILKPKIKGLVKSHFSKSYSDGDITYGKNLLAFNVVVRYIENFVDDEIKESEKHEIKILSLEQKLNIELQIPEIDFPVVLKGKLDRIDMKDGVVRIIDYKTGKVESKHVEIVEWSEATTDYDYSKAFQLLCYALMYREENPIAELEAGIISFKNLSVGLLKFAIKDKRGIGAKKEYQITGDSLTEFTQVLQKLIQEICDPKIPLVEKEV